MHESAVLKSFHFPLQASYYVFEKLKQEGFAGNDDVRLRTAMKVPRSMVGRVIGRGGKNVSVSTAILWMLGIGILKAN